MQQTQVYHHSKQKSLIPHYLFVCLSVPDIELGETQVPEQQGLSHRVVSQAFSKGLHKKPPPNTMLYV